LTASHLITLNILKRQVQSIKLNTSNKTEISLLDGIFSKSIPAVLAIETNPAAAFAGTPIQLPPGVDPFTVLAQLPPAQLDLLRAGEATQINAIPSMMLTQYSVAYISAQYKVIGVNISSIQNRYLIRIGSLMLLLTLASAAASITVGYLSARVAAGLGRNLRKQLFVRVESFSNTEFDKFSTASLITRSTNDITQIQMLMVMLFRIAFYAPILGIGGVLKVINADTSMLWIIAAALVAIPGDDGRDVHHRYSEIQKYAETDR